MHSLTPFFDFCDTHTEKPMHQLTPLPLKQGEKELCPKPQTERSGIAVSEIMNRSPHCKQIMFATNAALLPLPFEKYQPIHLSSSLTGRVCPLRVIQQRSSLLVCWDNILLPSEREFLAESAWERNAKCGDEQDSHDDESEDPLEGDGLRQELADAERSSQDAEFEAHCVILCHVSN
jgi:hypothetical protein